MIRILVVDDEPSSAQLLAAILSPLGVCEIALDGSSAFNILRKSIDNGDPFSLVCLDVQLGDLDGTDVLKMLREHEEARRVEEHRRARVVMTTVVDEPDKLVNAFEGRCDAYLVKPITRTRLFQRLESLGLEVPS